MMGIASVRRQFPLREGALNLFRRCLPWRLCRQRVRSINVQQAVENINNK
jgi:hypothetical protein